MRTILIGSTILGVVMGCCGMPGLPDLSAMPSTDAVSNPPALAVTGPDCVSFCRQSGACFTAAGKPLGPDESDCGASCAPGGSYTHMGPASFLCATRACGPAFDECQGNGLAAILGAGMSGAPLDPPATWPAGFPWFAGGIAHDPGVTGSAVVVTTLLYTLPPADLADVVRAEAARTGWVLGKSEAVEESQPGTSGKVRLVFSKGEAVVNVTVYAAEGQTVLLVMH